MSFIEKFLKEKALEENIEIETVFHSEFQNLWFTKLNKKREYFPDKSSTAVHEDKEKSMLLAFLSLENPSYTFLPIDNKYALGKK